MRPRPRSGDRCVTRRRGRDRARPGPWCGHRMRAGDYTRHRTSLPAGSRGTRRRRPGRGHDRAGLQGRDRRDRGRRRLDVGCCRAGCDLRWWLWLRLDGRLGGHRRGTVGRVGRHREQRVRPGGERSCCRGGTCGRRSRGRRRGGLRLGRRPWLGRGRHRRRRVHGGLGVGSRSVCGGIGDRKVTGLGGRDRHGIRDRYRGDRRRGVRWRRRVGCAHGHRGGVGHDCRRGRRCRCRCGRSGGRRRPDGQEAEGIHVALRVGGDANAEVDRAAVSGGADRPALGDGRAADDGERAEVEQRDGVAVGREDRERRAAARDRAGERDGSGRRREDRLARRGGDVDATVLAAGVRMGRVEDEGAQHLTAGRPGPCPRAGHG